MIDLYTWKTPNGYKIPIMLEECSLEYKIIPLNIATNAQFEPDYIKINPNSKIPAIVDHDHDSISIFESGAILIYLAEKTGKFLPAATYPRAKVMEWLMFQMAGIGPMFGQLFHFTKYAPEPIPYAIKRYTKESIRILNVMDKQLENNEYIAGDYSIADISMFPWVNAFKNFLPNEIEKLNYVSKWLESIASRDAVKRAMNITI